MLIRFNEWLINYTTFKEVNDIYETLEILFVSHI